MSQANFPLTPKKMLSQGANWQRNKNKIKADANFTESLVIIDVNSLIFRNRCGQISQIPRSRVRRSQWQSHSAAHLRWAEATITTVSVSLGEAERRLGRRPHYIRECILMDFAFRARVEAARSDETTRRTNEFTLL